MFILYNMLNIIKAFKAEFIKVSVFLTVFLIGFIWSLLESNNSSEGILYYIIKLIN